LGPGSFDNPKRLLARKQASFLITFGGVGFILTSTITLASYLGNWALVISVIATSFMVDQRLFLLEALT
jgi:hypothetical protein